MKKLSFIFSTMLLINFVSCSNSSRIKEENQIESQFDDAVALEDANIYQSEEGVMEDQYTDRTIEEPEEIAEAPLEDYAPVEEVAVSENSFIDNGVEEIQYTVKQGETLMLISFQLYGDYAKWKDIRDRNPSLVNYENLEPGQILTVRKPGEEFNWRPEGLPYLIKSNETLQVISQNLYDTTRKWMDIYQHNKPLIKDPDKIYAGFTIYYLEDGNYQRLPASL